MSDTRQRKREKSESRKKRNPDAPWLRDIDVADRYQVDRSSVWRWAKDGRLPPPTRIGGVHRWSREQLEAMERGAA